MYIIINSRGKTVTSRYQRAMRMTQKMSNKGFVPNTSQAFDEQVKEILKWSNEALESLDRVLDRKPDIK